ncbi:mersacidin/lichenicidin family type 2 lantibiotic [Dictyobacter arantiisoli]|uniref:Mersacidin/lichenicidin family type 2 lantibiotic n=1 Tax=Dictyobacter arantiisoli TaxID=2014874 RepID=A0A5A5T654_9CHLR|nr:mersacidin/lichenicidin family type 2 lantibiotic [Dictyobacter arantiisoli]GCF06931.1 hypothetical protein KDI_04950 [Dictyobacter arantiisoli]
MIIDIARAWKDAQYRNSLNNEERAQLPQNPIGTLELTDIDLATISGACGPECGGLLGGLGLGLGINLGIDPCGESGGGYGYGGGFYHHHSGSWGGGFGGDFGGGSCDPCNPCH